MSVKPYQGQYVAGRLPRRRVLRGIGLAGAGVAVGAAIGCGGETKPSASSEVREPRRGGILVRQGGSGAAQDSEGQPLDPHTTQPRTGITLRLVYQGLLGYHLVTYDVEPDLAQSWEQPSPTEYIFTLAPGVRWQKKPPVSGRELRADDVVFSLERARTNEPRFVNRSVIAMVDKIEAVDRGRIRITTKAPDVSTLSALSADSFLVLAPEVVEKAQKFTTPEEVIGTGPFILKSAEQGVGSEYVRNPDYWKAGLPYLEGIQVPYFADAETAFAAFLAGNLHVARVPGSRAKAYIARQGPGYEPLWYAQDFIRMTMPNTKVKPFDDPRVTRALRLLTDHQEFISVYGDTLDGGSIHGSIFAPAMQAWDVPQEEYTRHLFWKHPKDDAVREAVALLTAAGFSRTNPLRVAVATLDSETFTPGAQLLGAQWRRLGQGIVESEQIRPYDLPQWSAVRTRRQFSYGFSGNSGSIPEASVWLNQLWRSGGSRNYMDWSDPKADEMIDRQSTTFDTRQRKALVLEIVRYMMDQSPGVAAVLGLVLNALHPKVRGFAPEQFLNGRQYEWIWLDS